MTQRNKIIVSKEDYAIARSSKMINGAFANIVDKNEITVIIEQDRLGRWVIKSEKNFKLITFNVILPFSMTGFISRISTALAKEKIPVFVISAFSTDHLLIKEKYLDKTLSILNELGFEEQ